MIEVGEKVLFINLEEEVWRREELNIWSKSKKMEEIYPKNTKTSMIESSTKQYLKSYQINLDRTTPSSWYLMQH